MAGKCRLALIARSPLIFVVNCIFEWAIAHSFIKVTLAS